MAVEQIEDHVEQAQGLFIEQYQERPRLEAFLYSFTKQAQELEDVFWDVIVGRMLDAAVGVQLDAIGRLVVEPRQGREDDIYRVFLRGKIRANWSDGTPNDVIALLRILDPAPFKYTDVYPASFECEYTQPTISMTAQVLGPLMAVLLARTRAAGTHGSIIVCRVEDSQALLTSYDDDPAEDSTYQNAAYDEDELAGGVLAYSYGD